MVAKQGDIDMTPFVIYTAYTTCESVSSFARTHKASFAYTPCLAVRRVSNARLALFLCTGRAS